MKTVIITSQVGEKIVPIQKWLFAKYAPQLEINWIDMEDKHIENWCKNVAYGIEDIKPDRYSLFLLDDHLLLDVPYIPITIPPLLERLELGQRWSHHKNTIDRGDHLSYRPDTLYSVSTQPSIWLTTALIRVLRDVNANPWAFETKGRCKAGIVKSIAMKVIAETAISKRRPGKININGMKPEDRDELIKIGLLEESEIVFGW